MSPENISSIIAFYWRFSGSDGESSRCQKQIQRKGSGDDLVRLIKQRKERDGPPLQVHGSGNLIQTQLRHDLVDELWLKIFPLTLGPAKRLFADGTIPTAFTLQECKISPSGVIFASYRRATEVKTGSFAS